MHDLSAKILPRAPRSIRTSLLGEFSLSYATRIPCDARILRLAVGVRIAGEKLRRF